MASGFLWKVVGRNVKMHNRSTVNCSSEVVVSHLDPDTSRDQVQIGEDGLNNRH